MRGEKILKFFVEVGAVKTIRKFRTVVLGDVTKNIFKFLISAEVTLTSGGGLGVGRDAALEARLQLWGDYDTSLGVCVGERRCDAYRVGRMIGRCVIPGVVAVLGLLILVQPNLLREARWNRRGVSLGGCLP